jgi:hypothetical protein
MAGVPHPIVMQLLNHAGDDVIARRSDARILAADAGAD